MKKSFFFILGILLVLGTIGCGTKSEETATKQNAKESNSSNGEKVVIKIADSFPGSHLIPKVATIPWTKRIEELGKGKIKVEYYPAEQLGKAASLLDVARTGVADITYVGPLYVSDKMPLSGVSGNPGLVKDSLSGSKAFNKLVLEDLYELEFKKQGVKPLWAGTTPPYQIVNSKHPVKTIEDFKGLKIRTSGGLQEQMMQAWGATPVSISGTEIYSAWDRGTIDGTLISFFSWPGYQVDKVAKYTTTNAALSAFGITYVVNEKKWSSWPKEVQDAVWQASQEMPEIMGKGAMEDEDKLIEEYKKFNIEFYELPADELERWNKELALFNDKWAKDFDAKGLPASEILRKFKQYNEEFQQDFKKGGN
ncbi:TRAP transporter substrate-binding protein DctP [Aneurinibacillus sp. UBA3580]|jgi:TRAP-type C4-dicarboxylate transport system substrate-binding protein|uniref:TRAP transporter substrate-binding protein n=1 Tax=Aneurinibacillus sp. UBA3580 TaxID=1946041 RepID=UPI00257A409E|nr:TRAP transporter substrate-binding protein DctP [Aneurinibacillus sp. UBA3580]